MLWGYLVWGTVEIKRSREELQAWPPQPAATQGLRGAPCLKEGQPFLSLMPCVLSLQPPQYKLDPRLARLLGVHTQTRASIMQALWLYIKHNKLQDSHEKEYINCNRYFRQVGPHPSSACLVGAPAPVSFTWGIAGRRAPFPPVKVGKSMLWCASVSLPCTNQGWGSPCSCLALFMLGRRSPQQQKLTLCSAPPDL